MVSQRIARTLLLVGVLLILSGLSVSAVVADDVQPPRPDEDWDYVLYDEYRVSGPLLSFYGAHGGPLVIGYPVSDLMYNQGLNRWVQYFQYMRLDYHDEFVNPRFRVQPGMLNEEAGLAGNMMPDLPRDDPRCEFFERTSQNVCHGYLSFFDSYGGINTFGYPIGSITVDPATGDIIQPFQRGTMRYNQALDRIEMVDIGLGAYFAYIEKYGAPDGSSNGELDLIELRIAAGFSQPLLQVGTTGKLQNITVTASDFGHDNTELPLPGADVKIAMYLPYKTIVLDGQQTDASGVATISILIQPEDVILGEKVFVDVTVTYEGHSETVRTYFTPWW